MARAQRMPHDLCMRFAMPLLLSTLCNVGCPFESAWLLPESDAITTTRQELAKRGVQATESTHTLMNISTCTGSGETDCATVSFTLDGWDPINKIGFEYVSDDDPDFGAQTPFSEIKPSEALQTAVDQSLAGQATVLIIHQWAHETETLCREQFLAQLRARLDAEQIGK